MAKESLSGLMENIIVDSGETIKSMAVEYGHLHTLKSTRICILANGRVGRLMDTAYIRGVFTYLFRGWAECV